MPAVTSRTDHETCHGHTPAQNPINAAVNCLIAPCRPRVVLARRTMDGNDMGQTMTPLTELPSPPATVRDWTRRLALTVILVTCIGGAAFVLVGRPHGDCVVVGDMMATYSAFQDETASRVAAGAGGPDELLAIADAEADTARRLHRQARDVMLPALRRAAVAFADGVARAAETERADAERPAELDPFQAILPAVDPDVLAADDLLFSSAHVLLTACPAAHRPYGLG